MEKEFKMGRYCPWTKEYLVSLYRMIHGYCKIVTMQALGLKGQHAAMEIMAAYNMFKYPVVYIFVHYNYGTLEDLEMSPNDISSYMMYLAMVSHFTKDMMDGMEEQDVFELDKNGKITPALISICKEVLLIENMHK